MCRMMDRSSLLVIHGRACPFFMLIHVPPHSLCAGTNHVQTVMVRDKKAQILVCSFIFAVMVQ